MVMNNGKINFGTYIHELRIQHKYSLKIVADKLNIDISLLSKIEHGERQIQGHMLQPLAELFELDFKELQIQFLNQRIEEEYGNENYFDETILLMSKARYK
jgi:transcriptional regulator with XRE-family HTH domain